jgi:hypothetical protein
MSSEAEEGALEISREDLYELVWSKPMLELARDFKISDVGLARRCRRLGIPVPGRGYWARLDAGQKPHRPKLPAREAEPGDESALTVGRLSAPDNVLTVEEDAPSDIQALQEAYERQEPQALLMDAQWLRDRLAFEADAANKIEVTTTGARWHPAIKLHRDSYETAAKKMIASKKAAERYETWSAARKASTICWEASDWRRVVDKGERLDDTHKSSAFRVSLGTYQRALSIANALANAAKARGFVAEDDEKAGRIVLVGHGIRMELRITEFLNEAQRMETSYAGKREAKKILLPSGRLRISLGSLYHPGPTIQDKDGLPIDASLNDVYVACYKAVVRDRRSRRLESCRDAIQKVEEAKRAEERRLEAERQRRAAEERQNRRLLMREARRWQSAQAIRK